MDSDHRRGVIARARRAASCRRRSVALAGLVVVALTGCGSTATTGPSHGSGTTDSQSAAQGAAQRPSIPPCSVLTDREVEQAIGGRAPRGHALADTVCRYTTSKGVVTVTVLPPKADDVERERARRHETMISGPGYHGLAMSRADTGAADLELSESHVSLNVFIAKDAAKGPPPRLDQIVALGRQIAPRLRGGD